MNVLCRIGLHDWEEVTTLLDLAREVHVYGCCTCGKTKALRRNIMRLKHYQQKHPQSPNEIRARLSNGARE